MLSYATAMIMLKTSSMKRPDHISNAGVVAFLKITLSKSFRATSRYFQSWCWTILRQRLGIVQGDVRKVHLTRAKDNPRQTQVCPTNINIYYHQGESILLLHSLPFNPWTYQLHRKAAFNSDKSWSIRAQYGRYRSGGAFLHKQCLTRCMIAW